MLHKFPIWASVLVLLIFAVLSNYAPIFFYVILFGLLYGIATRLDILTEILKNKNNQKGN